MTHIETEHPVYNYRYYVGTQRKLVSLELEISRVKKIDQIVWKVQPNDDK